MAQLVGGVAAVLADEEHGLTEEQIKITDEAVEEIIEHYTREAGVRSLERQIASYEKHMEKVARERAKESQL